MQLKYSLLGGGPRFENIKFILCARNKQRFANNYMMTVQIMHFSTSPDDNADTNDTSEFMLLITDMKGTAICVLLYEGMLITADRHELPQNT